MPYLPCYFKDGRIYSALDKLLFVCDTLDELISCVAGNKLFVLVDDLLSEHDIRYVHELLGHKRATPYMSKSGGILALRIAQKKRSGFLVPASTWNHPGPPNGEVVRRLIRIFELFGYMAVTPASLSEKVLRSTLPDDLIISRPSIVLRNDLLRNHQGGRIDQALPRIYRKAFEYDQNKAYLHKSRLVPDPSLAPILIHHPSISSACDFPTGFWHCIITCKATSLVPLSFDAGFVFQDGCLLERWLWTIEIEDCLMCGWEVKIIFGYGFRKMSTFMEAWSDILWDQWQRAEAEHPMIRELIKTMMVGLPGRFLRSPETYKLIPLRDARPYIRGVQDGDLALQLHWKEEGDRIHSDYALRAEYDQESTALTPAGSYIVASMRSELFRLMKRETDAGNIIIRTYIDSIVTAFPLIDRSLIGDGLGQWKEKMYEGPFYAEGNRFVGIYRGTPKVKAPGLEEGSVERDEFALKLLIH